MVQHSTQISALLPARTIRTMIALAISRAHWLLISISMSVRPVSSFLPPTWAMVERSWW